jgi:hypothetical protein
MHSAGHLPGKRVSHIRRGFARIVFLILIIALASALSPFQAGATEQDMIIASVSNATGDNSGGAAVVIHKGAHCSCQHSVRESVGTLVKLDLFQTVRYPEIDNRPGPSLAGLPPLRPPSS